MIIGNPLVLNITNSVTIEFVANALLAIGASPVMSEDPDDAVGLGNIASAISINIGTIHKDQEVTIRSVLNSISGKPVVLDPVGCGATAIRTNVSRKILETGKITLVRGNASEISSLAGNIGKTRGVDSTLSSLTEKESAVTLARSIQGLVVVSGEVDLVTDGQSLARVYNGTPMMTKVTGIGCVHSAYLAAVIGSGLSDMENIARATAFFGYMGEIAEKLVKGTGSFRMHFLDALNTVKYSDVEKNIKFDIGHI